MKTYEEKKEQIFTWLGKFKPGEKYEILKNHKPETALFIVAMTIKYIQTNGNKCGISFNDSFTVIKKDNL